MRAFDSNLHQIFIEADAKLLLEQAAEINVGYVDFMRGGGKRDVFAEVGVDIGCCLLYLN